MRLDLYTRHLTSATWHFEQGIAVDVQYSTGNDGELLIVTRFNIATSVPDNTYSLAFHIEDTEGHLLVQEDAGLPGTGTSCQIHRVDVSTLPPTQHNLLFTI